jgi:GTP cyclohydrolase II
MRAKAYTFTWDTEQPEHLAMRLGAPAGDAPLVRLHSECLTGDVFGSQRCDCGPQLQESLFRLHSAGGWLLYLRQEGRGIGLYNKLDAYRLQERGLDTFAANRVMHYPDDLRDYGCAAAMLAALGIARVRLITNNPDKVNQLVAAGIEVVETLSTGLYVTGHNRRYLLAKARQANHALPIEMDEEEAP